MPPRASLPLFIGLAVLLCLAVPTLSASSSKSTSFTRSISHSKTGSRTVTRTRTHSKGSSASSSGAPSVSASSVASASSTSSTSLTATGAPSITSSNTPTLSLSSSHSPAASVTPTFSPTFFLSRCSKVTLSTYNTANCGGASANLGIVSGCNSLTQGATTVNTLYAVNNGLPFVSLFASGDVTCGNVATATYAGALDTCVNQGTGSFKLTCAVVASQTPSPSLPPSASGVVGVSATSTISSTSPASASASAIPNAYLCTKAVVNIFASSDCSGAANVLGGTAGIASPDLSLTAATGVASFATGGCFPLTFAGRPYFAAYVVTRGMPSVTLYASDAVCKSAVTMANWNAPNAVPLFGNTLDNTGATANYGGKAQYVGAFNTCVKSATGCYSIGCTPTGAGSSISATPLAAVPSASTTPSAKANQCSSVTVTRYSLTVFDAGTTCAAANLLTTYSAALYTCTTVSSLGYTALALPQITSGGALPLVGSSSELDVYYYSTPSLCASDLNLLVRKGTLPTNSLTGTISSAQAAAFVKAFVFTADTCTAITVLDGVSYAFWHGANVYYYTGPSSHANCMTDSLAVLTNTALNFVPATYSFTPGPIDKATADAVATALGTASSCVYVATLDYTVLVVPAGIIGVTQGLYYYSDAITGHCATDEAALVATTPADPSLALTPTEVDAIDFILNTPFGHQPATVGACTQVTNPATATKGIATKYDCNGYAPSVSPAPSASAVPHPALCAALAVQTYTGGDRTCASSPVTLAFPYVPLADGDVAINPFSSSSQTTKCLNTTLLGVVTYYKISIPAISSWSAASGVSYSTYAPTVTVFGSDSTCSSTNPVKYDLSQIENAAGTTTAATTANSNQAWGALGPDGVTKQCYSHGTAGGSPSDHYQVTCAGVLAPSATPSPSPSPCTGGMVISVYADSITTGYPVTAGCNSGTSDQNLVGTVTVPAKCGPVTYTSTKAAYAPNYDLVAKGIIAAGVYGAISYDATTGQPTFALYGGGTPTAAWGYQSDVQCQSDATSAGVTPVFVPASPADFGTCQTAAAGTYNFGIVANPVFHYMFTCASQVSATSTPTLSVTPTISTTPVHRLRRA